MWLVGMPLAIVLEGTRPELASFVGMLPGAAALVGLSAVLAHTLVIVSWIDPDRGAVGGRRWPWVLALWGGWAAAWVLGAIYILLRNQSLSSGWVADSTVLVFCSVSSVHVWAIDEAASRWSLLKTDGRSLPREFSVSFVVFFAVLAVSGPMPAVALALLLLFVRIFARLRLIQSITDRSMTSSSRHAEG
jgi:hypothetical protein